MRTGKEGLELIKVSEGFSSEPYLCPGGVWTIGYGTTRGVNKNSEPISKEFATELMVRDLIDFEMDVMRLVKVPLTQNQFDALVSFIYNIGTTAFGKSTLLRKLNKGDYDAVPTELLKWVWAGKRKLKGLVARRTAEGALWTKKDMEREDTVSNVEVKRDVPTIVNAENIAAAGAIGTTVSSVASDPASPMTWALAAIAVMTAAVFLYMFLRRRGA